MSMIVNIVNRMEIHGRECVRIIVLTINKFWTNHQWKFTKNYEIQYFSAIGTYSNPFRRFPRLVPTPTTQYITLCLVTHNNNN